jgi:hypothetical protein
MGKPRDTKKDIKKKPSKSIKEKRKEKQEKKKNRQSLLNSMIFITPKPSVPNFKRELNIFYFFELN